MSGSPAGTRLAPGGHARWHCNPRGGSARDTIRRYWAERTEWGAVWAARAVSAMGLVSIVSGVYPSSRYRLEIVAEVLPIAAPQIASGASAAMGLLLIALSAGLRRRKQRAWLMAAVASGALTVVHLVKGMDVEEAAFAAGVLALLMIARPAFTGAPDPRSRRTVAVIGALSFGATTMIGVLLIAVARHRIIGAPGAGRIMTHVWAGLIGLPGPVQFGSPVASARIATTLMLLGITAAGLTLGAALRPAGGPHPLSATEAERIRALLVGHGQQDSLAYFALRDDKSVMFSASGKAAVTYTVISGVTLASGDPLGDREAWPAAIDAWLDEARRYAWAPAVLGASEAGATAYHRAGLEAVEIGDEAIVDVPGFSLDGRSMRGVRQTVNRLYRKGFTVQIDRCRELSSVERDHLCALSRTWRSGGVERGFSMALGRVGDPRDPDLLIARAIDGDGVLAALLTFAPWGSDGLSLDVMRRSPQSDNGVVELMVAATMAYAAGQGVTRVSLNFAAFRAVFDRGERVGAGPVLRLSHRTLLFASRFWQLESLYRATSKYQPTWTPRFLCFARTRDLPRIGAAALEAEAFLRRPRWLPGLRRAVTPALPHEDARQTPVSSVQSLGPATSTLHGM